MAEHIDHFGTRIWAWGDPTTGQGAQTPTIEGFLHSVGNKLDPMGSIVVWGFMDGEKAVHGSCAVGNASIVDQYYLVTARGVDHSKTISKQGTDTSVGSAVTSSTTGNVELSAGGGAFFGGKIGGGMTNTTAAPVNTRAQQDTNSDSFTVKVVTGLTVEFRAGMPSFSSLDAKTRFG